MTLSQETVSIPPCLLCQLDPPECGIECGAWGGLELAWYVCEVFLLGFPLNFSFFKPQFGAYGILVLRPGIEPAPLHKKWGVLTTEPAGKSLKSLQLLAECLPLKTVWSRRPSWTSGLERQGSALASCTPWKIQGHRR